MGQKLGFVGASNISKEKKEQQNVRSSAPSCSDGGKMAAGPFGVDLEQEDRGARHQPLGQDAAQDRAGEEHAFRPYFLGERGGRQEKWLQLLFLKKSDFKQGVKDGKLKL